MRRNSLPCARTTGNWNLRFNYVFFYLRFLIKNVDNVIKKSILIFITNRGYARAVGLNETGAKTKNRESCNSHGLKGLSDDGWKSTNPGSYSDFLDFSVKVER